jgi:hypothetical protein
MAINLPGTDALVKTAKTYALDLFERVISSAVGGFLAVFVPAQATSLSMWWAAGGAGVAAAWALLKGMVAKGFGDKNSASLAKSV